MLSMFLSEEKEENLENKLSVTFGYYSAGTNSLMQKLKLLFFSAKSPLKITCKIDLHVSHDFNYKHYHPMHNPINKKTFLSPRVK